MEAAVPPSKISALSSGEFLGMVADDSDNRIELKTFYCEILNDHNALKKEQDNYEDIPVIRKPDNVMVQRNYLQIKQDIQDINQSKVERVLSNLELSHQVIKKG